MIVNYLDIGKVWIKEVGKNRSLFRVNIYVFKIILILGNKYFVLFVFIDFFYCFKEIFLFGG